MTIHEPNYYNIKNLIHKGEKDRVPFLSAIGGKGNGKTYSAILYGIEKFFELGIPFVYLRRNTPMIHKSSIGTLLNPHEQTIMNLSHNKYNSVRYVSGRFELFNYDNDSVPKRTICYCRSLTNIESQTGADLGRISCVIYDECLSRTYSDIPLGTLIIAHKNYLRSRTEYMPFILIGNTFTRSSALFEEFGVDLRKIKQGTVTRVTNIHNDSLMLLEYCADISETMTNNDIYYRFSDENIDMVVHGKWTIDTYKILNGVYDNIKPVCQLRFVHNNNNQKLCVDVSFIPLNARIIMYVTSPDREKPDIYISDTMFDSKECLVLPYIPTNIKNIMHRCLLCDDVYNDNNENTEILRDILKHVANTTELIKQMQ